MTAIVKMADIGKIFETEEMETHALTSINLVINQGDYVAISGPSGCGKSTLLSLIGLLDTPSSGQYWLDGKEVAKLSLDQAAEYRSSKIGFIFQSFNLIDELSVFDNIALPLRYHQQKFSAQAITAKVNECLDKVGLSHRAQHKPNQLSGGQQQRVAIARALVADPAIILADEPTGNLDSQSGDNIMRLLAELHQQGTTICMVTHDLRYADMAETNIQLLDGMILTTPSLATLA